MKCPTCGRGTLVLDTRQRRAVTRRRRQCPKGHRFTTHEVIAADLEEARDRTSKRLAPELDALQSAIDNLRFGQKQDLSKSTLAEGEDE